MVENKFKENTLESFAEYCKAKGIVATTTELLNFLMNKNFIPKEEVKIALVVSEVNKISVECNVSKTAAVRRVEAVYSIPESTCFYILDKHQIRHK